MLLPRTIATTIDKVARQAVGKDWGLYAALLNHWSEIVGSNYAELLQPVKISFPKGKPDGEKWSQGQRTDATLHIRIPQGLVMEFSCKTDQIRQRIASFFGYSAIEKIAFEPYYASTTPEKPKSVDKKLDATVVEAIKNEAKSIENEELRAAIEKLGEAMAASESNRNS